jgi:hypothetical protein
MNNRWKTGLVLVGLTLVAVPTIGAARTHYTGRVPASIAAITTTTAPRHVPVKAVHAVSHKKLVTVSRKAKAAHKATGSHKVTASHRKAAVKTVATGAAHQTSKKAQQRAHKKSA